MRINIHIEADSVEEAKSAFAQLAGTSSAEPNPVASNVTATPEPVKEAEKPATTRKRAEKATEAHVVNMTASADPLAVAPATPAADPLAASNSAVPPVTADPLAGNSVAPATPAADPLAASTPVASTPVASTPTASAPASTGAISLQTIREKIGTLTDKKQQVKDLVATYKKADGAPCEKPSDIQEKDYEAIFEDLDYL